MNYELAKQLKDAGFPFNWRLSVMTSQPTITELIEVCGDKFYQLTNGQAGFIAFSYPEFGEHYGEGKTPEESVARLWLALNQKG